MTGHGQSVGFPTDDYTPHGYLANPYAVAHSWSVGSGGNLRGTREAIGFGWVYPWARGAKAGAQIELGLVGQDGRLTTRAEVELQGLSAPHHSSLLFEYAWEYGGALVRARFVLLGPDELGLEVELSGRPLPLYVAAVGWRRDGGSCTAESVETDGGPVSGRVDLGEPYGAHELIVAGGGRRTGAATDLAALAQRQSGDRTIAGPRVAVGVALVLDGWGDESRRFHAVLRRVGTGAAEGRGSAAPPQDRGAPLAGSSVVQRVGDAIGQARRLDDAFWSGAARLVGDWPASWRRGWVYDLETTRMCIFPPGGVFQDVWPAWSIQWPRAVLAEGSLDALRLAYADPELAKRAVLSLFRDAPAPNVPCIFQHGEPNMVAADGSVCGTSPAWCVPFYNLERLYLSTLDDRWLASLYPLLARYLEWWLRERTDQQGWAVYKCTWEAGEDDTPRLDPDRRGDNVVSEYVRPVELEATMALSASVLVRFATRLGHDADAARWRTVADEFATRTAMLWDEAEGRFRDWDRQAGRFVQTGSAPNYWGIDPCRYSALAFTPLLAGLADAAQTDALGRELEAYAAPPWTLWASWSYVVLEAALVAGQRRFTGRVAAEIVDRVWRELDRRGEGAATGPTPGVAREYWPLDLDSWDACDGYGWGATTASFLVRQIFGFLESDAADGLLFRLAPSLPAHLLAPGQRYGLVNLAYRGASLDVEYIVQSNGLLEIRLSARVPTTCDVRDEFGETRYESPGPSEVHVLMGESGALYEVELRP